MRVLIKGAGVAGLTSAHELVARGAEVMVSDPSPGFASAASWYAGGMLAPWCERESAEEAVLTRGIGAADWWEAVLPAGSVHRNGTLVVAPPRDAAELKRFASRTSGFRWIGAEEIGALEPALAGRFRQALFFAEEAHLDPRLALSTLRQGLEAQGVVFSGGPIDEGRFDLTIDCTGAAQIGDIEGLRGVRGEMLYLQTEEVALSRPVRLLHPRIPLYIVPRSGGLFMCGATMIESDDAGPMTARSLMEILNGAYTLHPAFAEARLVETGTGVRPAYADNLPRVSRHESTITVNGLYRHGFLLSPALAEEVAALALGQPCGRPLPNPPPQGGGAKQPLRSPAIFDHRARCKGRDRGGGNAAEEAPPPCGEGLGRGEIRRVWRGMRKGFSERKCPMKFTINGEEHELPATTVADLLLLLEYEGEWLATAVNGELVHGADRARHRLSESDRIEILSPMQGG
ncbi:putative thiamine biosynthesis oxidoreductase ThiO (plasmid) [Sinorhizobium fredii NGR234]|uniref:D-amino-acid oxidase n=2 Tax=Rhizobium fredii TaxID=380 RepID=C3KNU9_SINFN|nr:putative thiamine biosynthesis oxidoreductase ThiO [Sinorhizobium fredii NGR234]